MTSVPSVTWTLIVAAGLWLGVHVVLSVLYIEYVALPPIYLLAVLILLAGSALSLRPLFDRAAPREPRWVPAAIAVAIPLAEALNLLSIVPGKATSYANWANGGAAVMLTGLVLRGHTLLAAVAGGTSVAMMSTAYLTQDPKGNALSAIFVMSVPAQMWVLGPYGVRTVVTRAQRLASSLNQRAATEAAQGPVRSDWEVVRGQRLRELEQQVLPFLAHVSDVALVGPVEKAQAGALARTLRDSLLARQLLDPDVQVALAEARGRGVTVSLGSDAAAGPVSTGLRPLLPELMSLSGLTALTVRVAGTPQRATVVVKGDVRPREVAAALRPLLESADVDRTRTDTGVVFSVRARSE